MNNLAYRRHTKQHSNVVAFPTANTSSVFNMTPDEREMSGRGQVSTMLIRGDQPTFGICDGDSILIQKQFSTAQLWASEVCLVEDEDGIRELRFVSGLSGADNVTAIVLAYQRPMVNIRRK